jgi:hypothetical protein
LPSSRSSANPFLASYYQDGQLQIKIKDLSQNACLSRSQVLVVISDLEELTEYLHQLVQGMLRNWPAADQRE